MSVVEPSTSRLRARFLVTQPAIHFGLSSDAELSIKDETGNVYWTQAWLLCRLFVNNHFGETVKLYAV